MTTKKDAPKTIGGYQLLVEKLKQENDKHVGELKSAHRENAMLIQRLQNAATQASQYENAARMASANYETMRVTATVLALGMLLSLALVAYLLLR